MRSAARGRQARRPPGNRAHPPGQLLQRQPRHWRAERLYRRQADRDPGDRGRRLVQTATGEHAAFASVERVRHDRGGDARRADQDDIQRREVGHCVLHGPLGLRRLEQFELRDGGDQGPLEEPAKVHHDRDTAGDAVLRVDQRVVSGGDVAPRDDR